MDADSGGSPYRALIGAAADRLGVSPAAVIAGVVAVLAAGVGGWWALRAPDPVPTESIVPSVFQTPIPTPPPATTTTLREVVLVDVGGAVAIPGVHELRPGDRVVDAIRAAGGLTSEADRRRLNMAMLLVDGQRIWIPTVGEDEPAVVMPEGGSSGSAGTSGAVSAMPVNLNQTDAAGLETLPGVGPSIAAAIIKYRTERGPFRRVEDLQNVPGIGQVKMEQLSGLVTV